MTTPTSTKAEIDQTVQQIERTLEELPEDAQARWVKVDNRPYIHATDDPKASAYGSPVVGRFDYLKTADYMLACCPPNIRAVLDQLAAERAEVERLRAALMNLLGGVGECLTSQGVRVIDCPVGIAARQVLYPDAALATPTKGGGK